MKSPPPLSLNDRIKAAGLNVTLAQGSHDIWWLYKGETRGRYLKGMNTYSEFFRFDEEAHFRAMIVGIMTLFDSRLHDTVPLSKLISDVEELGINTQSIKAKLDALKEPIRGIKFLRHKLFAHRDQAMTLNQIYEKARLRPDDIKLVLSQSLEIVNCLENLRGLAPTYVNFYVIEFTTRLLADIQPVDARSSDNELSSLRD
jgi:hypothetical protein